MTDESRIEISLDPAKIHGHKFTVNGIEYEIKRKMIDGFIYKIVNEVDDMVYVGSTIKTLTRRYQHHVQIHDISPSSLYKKMREVGVDKCSIVLIEEVVCKSKKDLLLREQHHLNQVPVELRLNDRNAAYDKGYQKQWRVENRTRQKEYHKNYQKARNKYRCSWGGWLEHGACNLLSIDVTLFE
jgi:hypothetical protein